MISPFIVNDKNLFLSRFPEGQVNRSLQAWDAADEYLINHITENNLVTSETRVAIFNDSFGALATNFCDANDAAPRVFCINDSYISAQGIRYNIEQNALAERGIKQLSSLDAIPQDINVILYKIPKSKSLLIEQLLKIKQSVGNDCIFIAADRAKEIHSATLKVFEKYLGATKTSLAVKKARLVFCQLDVDESITDENKSQINSSPFPTVWYLEHQSKTDLANKNLKISNHANVYAREKLDIGARYFIDNLPTVAAGTKVIDLGCGNGVIGLSVLADQPEANITFIDESNMAIASAKENVSHNFPELVNQCDFQLNDCLTDIESNSVDLILCNPPFHQNTATTDHIAWQMFKDSHRVLKKGGELRIIGNRQLAYHIKLQRIFGNEKLIASNKKFVTQSAIKR